VAIMCSALFRGTLLREVFRQTSTFNGKSMSSWTDSEVEKNVKSINEGGLWYSCVNGLTGTSGLTLGKKEEKLSKLIDVMKTRIANGACDQAARTDAVVHLRMGDLIPDYEETRTSIVNALTSASTANVTRLVFNAVLHYGGYDTYNVTDESLSKNGVVLDKLVNYFRGSGYSVMVRSNSDADADLCYLASAPVLIVASKGGFASMLGHMHDVIARATKSSAIRFDLADRMAVAEPMLDSTKSSQGIELRDDGSNIQSMPHAGPRAPHAYAGNGNGFQRALVWGKCSALFKKQLHSTDSVGSQEHRFLFVDNVKAASTSIRTILHNDLQVGWGGHCGHWYPSTLPHTDTSGKCQRLSTADISPAALRDVFKFTIVRDPIAKFESGVRQAWLEDPSLRILSADEILDAQLARPLGSWVNEHLQPSSWRLSGYNDGQPVHLDFIGSTETLDEDWPAITNLMQNTTKDISSLGTDNSHSHAATSKLSALGIKRMCASELYGSEWSCFGYQTPHVCKS